MKLNDNKKSQTAQKAAKPNAKDFFSSKYFYIVFLSVLILILVSLGATIYFSLCLPNDVTYMQKKAFDIFTNIVYTGFTALIGLMVGKYTMEKRNAEDD